MSRFAASSPLVRKLSAVADLSNDEVARLEDLHRHPRTLPPGSELVAEGDRHEASMIVVEGWAYRYKVLSNGRQQVINFLLPGDIVGPFASVIDVADHSVAAITSLRIATFEPASILELFATCPRIGVLYGWAVGRDEAILSEQVVRVGRRSAFERTAHLLLELLRRLQHVNAAGVQSFELPLTQDLLADALGLSTVHVNRTLRRLRDEGLLVLSRGWVRIPDIERLQQAAEFTPDYLEQDSLPEETQAELDKL
ncbi:MAG: Crp/Fnr family transcriptional regulator [Rhodobacterales bacterium]|nr:Crp/Fnr family transcriptional regulator [Rhodobacterales bacterium]